MALFKRNKQVEERALGTCAFGNSLSNEGFIALIGAVFQALTKISNSIAILPITVRDGNTVDENHAFNKLFDNSNLGKFNFLKKLVWDIILHGNGYAYIQRDVDGNPTGLLYLTPTLVNHMYVENILDDYFLVTQYNLGRVESKDMLHFYVNTQDGRHGKPITFYGKNIFDLAKFCDSAAAEFFSSGMNLSGILTIQGNPSQAEIENIRTNWAMLHAHSGLRSPLAILRGNMQYQTVSQSSKEAQLLETRQFMVAEVARVFNMSPVLLGDLTHMSYGTLEQTLLDFMSSTLLPYIVCIESEFRRKLCAGTNITIDLDESYLLRTDKSTLSTYLTNLVNGGIITRNEARRTLNLPPVDGGDDLTVSYTSISDNKINGESADTEENEEKI